LHRASSLTGHRSGVHHVTTECLLLAQSGHSATEFQCPLLGVQRTSRKTPGMSANDPKRTFEPSRLPPCSLTRNPISSIANPCCNRVLVGVVPALGKAMRRRDFIKVICWFSGLMAARCARAASRSGSAGGRAYECRSGASRRSARTKHNNRRRASQIEFQVHEGAWHEAR